MTCNVPGCTRAPRTSGPNCHAHYNLERKLTQTAARPTPLATFPRWPKRTADALARLAETPGLTLDQYERRKTEILRRNT